MPLLSKDNVVDLFVRFLVRDGWTIVQRLPAGEKGVDILAARDGVDLLAEVKGQASKNGRPVDGYRTASSALMKAASLRHFRPNARIVIVVPNSGECWQHFEHVISTLAGSRIEVALVDTTGEVQDLRSVLEDTLMLGPSWLDGSLQRDFPSRPWPEGFWKNSLAAALPWTNGDLGEVMVVNDEIDDDEFELHSLDAAIARRQSTLSYNGFYLTENENSPGRCMLTQYDYSFGTDYEDIETAIQWVQRLVGNATAWAASKGLASHRGYIVGYDYCRRDRYGVFINEITVGNNFESVGAAIAFIRDFVVRRRERAESGESYAREVTTRYAFLTCLRLLDTSRS